jgi:hypothetical protein
LFEQGLRHSQSGELAIAAQLFERSLESVERPATVFNLVLVYERLNRPYDLVRSVQRFMLISDPLKYQVEREHASALAAVAYTQLAELRLELEPVHAEVLIDGAPPLRSPSGHPLLSPGEHALSVAAAGYTPQHLRLTSEANRPVVLVVSLQKTREPPELVALSVQLPLPKPPPREVALAPKRVLRPLAWWGAGVWSASVGVYLLAQARAQKLEGSAIDQQGFLSQSERYLRARRAVVPLALIGGLACAAAIAGQDGSVRRPHLALVVTVEALGLLAGALGVVLSARDPEKLGSSTLTDPRRHGSAIFLSSSLIALTWGTTRLSW